MDNYLTIHNGHIDSEKLFKEWYKKYRFENYGAFITFVGIIRDENSINGLSFDIYRPILNSWFQEWQNKAENWEIGVGLASGGSDATSTSLSRS